MEDFREVGKGKRGSEEAKNRLREGRWDIYRKNITIQKFESFFEAGKMQQKIIQLYLLFFVTFGSRVRTHTLTLAMQALVPLR